LFLTASMSIFSPRFVLESMHNFFSSDQFRRLQPGSMDLS
jgi:hypothetical protein